MWITREATKMFWRAGCRDCSNLLGNLDPYLRTYPLPPSLIRNSTLHFTSNPSLFPLPSSGMSEESYMIFSNHLEPERFLFTIQVSAGGSLHYSTARLPSPPQTQAWCHLLPVAPSEKMSSLPTPFQAKSSNEQQHAWL